VVSDVRRYSPPVPVPLSHNRFDRADRCIGNAYGAVVLSTAKIKTGAWRYYANQVTRGRCEYFLGMGEAPGRWEGHGLDHLGLPAGGRVAEKGLEAAFGRAIHPHTGEQLGRPWRADGVTGYDLCLSAPKSVSALWAIGREMTAAEVLAAHQAAVSAALEYVDGHASFSRVGADGHTQVPTGGWRRPCSTTARPGRGIRSCIRTRWW